MSKNPQYFLQSLDNALSVIDVISAGDSLSLSDIHKKTGYSNATLLRMLCTLEAHHCIYKDDNGKYHLGHRLAYWGNKVDRNNIFITTAHPYLVKLRDKFNETAHINFLLNNGNVLFAHRIPANRAIVMNTIVGSELEAYCTATGKALLSCLNDHDLSEMIDQYHFTQYTPTTIMNKKALIQEINLIRDQGYAIDNEESEDGLYCISVPVKENEFNAVAAISLSGPAERMKPNQTAIINALSDTSLQIHNAYFS